jgi:hypothetical protein
VRVEAEEVRHFTGGVDFRLIDGLGLAQHGGRIQRGSPRRGQQLCRTQHHGGAVLPVPRRPFLLRLGPGRNGRRHVLGTSPVKPGDHVLVVVRGAHVGHVARVNGLAADDHRDFRTVARHGGEATLQLHLFR